MLQFFLGSAEENKSYFGLKKSNNITQVSKEHTRKNLKSVTTARKKANPKMLLDKLPTRCRVPSEGVESFNEDTEIIDLKIKMPRLDFDALATKKSIFNEPEVSD